MLLVSRLNWWSQARASFRNQQLSKLSVILITTAIVANLVLLFLMFEFVKVSPHKPWLDKIFHANKGRYATYYAPSLSDGIPTSSMQSNSRNWVRQRNVLELYKRLSGNYNSGNALLQSIQNRCMRLSEFDWIHDDECRAWWMAVLHNEQVVDIGIMLGFTPSEHKLGAMQLIFSNGMKGWFKPCGLSDEYPENEVVASAFDFVMGFQRSPPALIRNITVDTLRQVIWKKGVYSPFNSKSAIIEQTARICSSKGIFSGAIIGWWTGLKDGKSLPKTMKYWDKYMPGIDVRETRMKLPDIVNAEEVHIHLMLYLLNILRIPGKNEFVFTLPAREGDPARQIFVGVDLDRANLTIKAPAVVPTLCLGCVMGNHTFEILKKAAFSSTALMNELRYFWRELGGFNLPPAKELSGRIERAYDCMNDCINLYKAENVIIPDEIWVS